MQPYYDDELTDRAVRAYWLGHKRAQAEAERQGLGYGSPMIPNRHLTGLRELDGKRYVVVATGGYTLAVYRVTNQGQLRRLRRWPKTLVHDASARDRDVRDGQAA